MSNILIIGAGQLGSRYLQGLANSKLAKNIIVSDTSQSALQLAKQRYEEVRSAGMNNVVYTCRDSEVLGLDYDLAIVATSSGPRAKVVSRLAKNCFVSHWIIEKVIAQSIPDIDQIVAVCSQSSGAWVNHWMRIAPWAKEVKTRFKGEQGAFKMRVKGGVALGLACNVSHYLDYLSWLSDEEINEVITDGLEKTWFPSKRPGYFEVHGQLNATFTGGSNFSITSTDSDSLVVILLQRGHLTCETVFMINGEVEVRWENGKRKVFGFPLQSEMTASLVDEILTDGVCHLPDLNSSAHLHSCLLESMTEHWRATMDSHASKLPIT